MSRSQLSDWERLTIEAGFWQEAVRTPAFRRARAQARADAKDGEDLDVPHDLVDEQRAVLRLPNQTCSQLGRLFGMHSSSKDPRRPPGTVVSGPWEFERKLRFNFSITYANHPIDKSNLGEARTLTEAKRKARRRADMIAEEEWERLRLPFRDRMRGQHGELERAGKWLADHYLDGMSYRDIAARDLRAHNREETVKKAVQEAAGILGLDLRRRLASSR